MPPSRRHVTVLVAAALLATIAGPAPAQDADDDLLPEFDHVHGGNVTPPGNIGHVPATDLPAALAGEYEAANTTDQRDLYVDWERKDWALATPERLEQLGEPAHPDGRDDVSLWVDEWGVPIVVGESDAATQFGVGWAMASQRLFQADVFRHVARGEMAEFLGGQEWYDYDRAWRREFYTDDELLAMLEASYTEEEQALLQAYLDGLNAYVDAALQDPTLLPAEYAALGIVPEHWDLTHSLAVFVLQARDSVEGFGQELENALMLADLQASLGPEAGLEAFRDLRFVRDPGAYTTAQPEEGGFDYPGGGFEGVDAPGVAVPDDPDDVAAAVQHETDLLSGLAHVGLARKQASNAIAVSGDLTASGDPILLGGPQLDYLVPGIFWEFEAHSPTQHARGIGFAGTAGAVLIGKTPTHAWSITYGYTDQVDVFLVPLDPERPDTHYLRDGQAHELATHTSTVTCKVDQVGLLGSPDASDLCDGLPAAQTDVVVQRVPEYGAVIGRVDVDGQPHAVVKVRAHWMREVANGKPFVAFNQPATIDEFRAAQDDYTISLNLNYVDDQGNAGFWHVAQPPIRAEGTDVRLPTLGTGEFDWQGTVPLDDVPHAINPAQGFTANWNNQVATGWHNGDQNSWADIQRVDVLARGMESLADRGEVTPEDLWALNRHAAHADVRFEEVGARVVGLLQDAGLDGLAADALGELAAWDGQRTSSEVDGTLRYDAPATELWDRFFATFQEQVFADELGDRYDALFTDLDPDFYYLAMPVVTRVLKGDDAPLPAQHDWLDGTALPDAVKDAFTTAVDDLAAEFGGEVDAWRGAAVLTTYQEVGLLSVEPHAFMNRGTYNQLAVVDTPDEPGRRGPPAGVPPVDPPGRAARSLPATGGGLGALAGLAVLAGGGMLASGRCRRPGALAGAATRR